MRYHKFIIGVLFLATYVCADEVEHTLNFSGWTCPYINGFPCPYPGDSAMTHGLAFDGTNLWVTNFFSDKIYRLDYNGNKIGEIPAPEGDSCVDLDYDPGGYLWVQSHKTKRIYKINPSNGEMLTNFPSPAQSYPTGLAFDGTYLWVVDMEENKIYKIGTTGRMEGSFNIPREILPERDGARCLAYDRYNGTLVLYVTHLRIEGNTTWLDSTYIYGLTMDGRYTGFSCRAKGNGRLVCHDYTKNQWWIDGGERNVANNIEGRINKMGPNGIEENKLPSLQWMNFAVLPNPAHNNVIITFYVAHTKKVTATIYDITGQLVHCITNDEFHAGTHIVRWEGINSSGKSVPSGVYFCRVETDGLTMVKKLVFVQ